MKNYILAISFILLTTAVIGQNKTSPKPTTSKVNTDSKTGMDVTKESRQSYEGFFRNSSSMSILSTQVEFGGAPSDADVSFINIYGLLGLNFDINRLFYIGPYFKQNLVSTNDYQTMLVDGKSVNLASFKEWGSGLTVGTYLMLGKSMVLSPEIRLGYNEYNMQQDNYTEANKLFVNHTYFNLSTRLNLGFRMSDFALFGLNGGYNFAKYISGAQSGAYNPQGFTYAAYIKFYLPR